MKIKFEIWGGKKYIVVRDNKSKIITRRRAKYKDSIVKARQELGNNLTFKKDLIKSKSVFHNKTKEITLLTKSNVNRQRKLQSFNIPDRRSVQYIVEGTLNGQKIVARSSTIHSFDRQSKENARNQAWYNFTLRLSNPDGEGGYDEDEGKEILSKVKNVREGFVYYTN